VKTYTGIVVGFSESSVTLETKEARLKLQAGSDVIRQAQGLLGRKVRFTAELSSGTLRLDQPLLVVGSGYGLQAVVETAASHWAKASKI